MRLYVVRHGIAAELGEAGAAVDAERRLTAKGRKRMRAIARGLRRLGVTVGTVYSSPLVRAVQTAEILARAVSSGCEVVTDGAFAPGIPPAQAAERLTTVGAGDVMVVGHMPSVQQLCSQLLGGVDGIDIMFKKGAVCCLSLPDTTSGGGASLQWLLQPRVLRRCAEGR